MGTDLELLAWLERWYASQCDGDWEHSFGITIGTLDNPGWRVRVDLDRSSLAGVVAEPVDRDPGDDEWISCAVRESRFEGYGGPLNLRNVLWEFRSLAERISGPAPESGPVRETFGMGEYQPDWGTLWRVERDICYLYQQHATCGGVVAERALRRLCWLPYGDYISGVPEYQVSGERYFIPTGCLMVVLNLAWACMLGPGWYLRERLGAWRAAVQGFDAPTAGLRKLKRFVLLVVSAAEHAEGPVDPTQEMEELAEWAIRKFVGGYFRHAGRAMASGIVRGS